MPNELQITFAHPTNGETLTANIDPNLTADELYGALLSEGFISPLEEGQHILFGVNGRSKISGSQTLASVGATDGCLVQVHVDGDAGAL